MGRVGGLGCELEVGSSAGWLGQEPSTLQEARPQRHRFWQKEGPSLGLWTIPARAGSGGSLISFVSPEMREAPHNRTFPE